jgi:hypothetical protein
MDSLKNETILKNKMGLHLCSLMVVWFKQEKTNGKKYVTGPLFRDKDRSQTDRPHKKVVHKRHFSAFNAEEEALKKVSKSYDTRSSGF